PGLRESALQMGWFLIEEAADAVFVGWAGRVVVGRGAAGRGAGAAGGFGGVGCVVGRSLAAGTDRGALAGGGCCSWASDDLDGELCAFDGGQAAHGLGLRNAGAGGFGLVASAAVLFDRAGRA